MGSVSKPGIGTSKMIREGPEGREAETQSEDVIFIKVGREPNRFEIVF